MKLSTLAIAIVAATASMSAHSAAHTNDGLSLSGMARATYNAGGSEAIDTTVELNLDASATSKSGITYFGHAQLEGNGLGGGVVDKSVTTDDIYVGMKGGFGEARFGDTDNGCDATDVGGYPDYIFDIGVAGCSGSDQNNITYIGTAGAISYAASYSPENNVDNFSVGVKGKFGPASVSLGHTAGGNSVNAPADTTVLGLAGAFGPVGLGLRVSDVKDMPNLDDWQAHASYSAGANTLVIATNEPGDVTGYWTRDLGASTTFGIEVNAPDVGDTEVALRLQKGF